MCPAAAPRLIRVLWTSHVLALNSPSPQYPCPALNARSTDARATTWTESTSSRVHD